MAGKYKRRYRNRDDGARRAGDVIGEVLGRYNVSKDIRVYQIINQWSEIVGPRLSDKARPRIWGRRLKDGILHVEVKNSAWLNELNFIKKALIQQVNAAVGAPPLVTEIRFHLERDDPVMPVAKAWRPNRPMTKKLQPPPAAQGEDLERICKESECVDDPELRDIIIATRRRWNR